jgi:plasmid stabilization system protein ParE
MSYIVSPQAEEDIFGVWRYLYERAGIEVANRVESELYAAFDALAQNPRIGHKRSDLPCCSLRSIHTWSCSGPILRSKSPGCFMASATSRVFSEGRRNHRVPSST